MSRPLALHGNPGSAIGPTPGIWSTTVIPLAVGLAGLGFIYLPEISGAVRIWIASTAFNHCLLVLPIAAYLFYERRDALAATLPQAVPLMGAAALPFAAAWLIAERMGIMEARQLLAMAVLQVLVLATIGPRAWWVAAAPLLYLFFLVPTGEFLVPSLQGLTARFVGAGLSVLGVPRFIDGITIEIPEGSFLVAEACAGLRFLIASLAFGALYACCVYTSPWRRLLFMILSLAIPIAANGFRALGIVYLGHLLGSAQAAAVDHVLYGWLFFTIVTLLMILAGLPFRQSRQPTPPVDRHVGGAGIAASAAAVAVVVMSAGVPRLAAVGLDRNAVPVSRSAMKFSLPQDCAPAVPSAGEGSPLQARPEIASLTHSYHCGTIHLRLTVFPTGVGAGPVFAALRGASIAPGWDEIASGSLALDGRDAAGSWHVTDLERNDRFISVAATQWIDGRQSAGGIAGRLRQALTFLHPGAAPTVLAVATTEAESGPARAHAEIEEFLRNVDGLSAAIAKSRAARPAADTSPQ